MSPASTLGLEVQGLRIELLSGLPVVEDISFSVAQGETLALVGESGSGKTTTALALLGFARRGLRIAEGEIEIGGQTVPLDDEHAARALRGGSSRTCRRSRARASTLAADRRRDRRRLRAHLPDEPAGRPPPMPFAGSTCR